MTLQNIKLFATDLDGTLFSSFGTLSKTAKDALIALRKKGVIVVISSGRPYYSIQRTIPKECYDYASCMNGQQIVHQTNGSIIQHRDLNPEEISYLTGMIEKYPVVLACSFEHQFTHYCSPKMVWRYHVYEFGRYVLSKLRRSKFYHEELRTDYQMLDQEKIGKICFSANNRTLKKVVNELKPKHFSYFMVSPVWLEVQPENISKGKALQEIMALENLQKDACVAIGDGENDLPMLEAVTHSVAMKNAMSSVKKVCRYEADSFLNDGCAKWIINNLL